ncbi:MAG: hypothetical protein OXD30_10935 [Bryobacterales bacterium]|nr:hypothetical protein [Bryobacterales bacterium]
MLPGPALARDRNDLPPRLAGKIGRLQEAPHPSGSEAARAPRDAPRWKRAYALVLAHLALWIAGLWVVGRLFGGAS